MADIRAEQGCWRGSSDGILFLEEMRFRERGETLQYLLTLMTADRGDKCGAKADVGVSGGGWKNGMLSQAEIGAHNSKSWVRCGTYCRFDPAG